MNKTHKTAGLLAALVALALAGLSGSVQADGRGHHYKYQKHERHHDHRACRHEVHYAPVVRHYYYQPQVRYYYDDYAPARYYDEGGYGDITFNYRYRF